MPYHVLDPDALRPTPDHPCDRRSIGESVELAILAAAVYRLEPGDQLPTTYHYHDHREEVFYVLDGTLHVETPAREYVVQRDRMFVAEPGSPHRAFNPADADRTVAVFGVGAPATDVGHPYEPDSGGAPGNE